MKTILIPVDFSALSHNTVHFGLELAQRINARVLLLHVVQPLPPVPALAIPPVEFKALASSQYEQMARMFHQFEDEIADYQRRKKLSDVAVSSRLVEGNPADCILEMAEAKRASFIVMGTVGRPNAWDKLIGSVTSAVAQRANQPVWILPGAVSLDSLRQFVYFADMEGKEVRCIKQVFNLGERLRAKMNVVHISPVADDEFSMAEGLIETFENVYAPDRITFWHLTFDSVPAGIETCVQSHQPDAIVLAHRNRSFIEKIVHRSLIRQLALTTRRPLLIIPKPS